MPVTKTAKKALRQSQTKYEQNKPLKSKARTMLKKVRLEPTEINLTSAFSALDKAAKRKIFHQGKVNRLKSRLSKLVASSAK